MAKNESYIQHPVDTVGFGGSSRILDLKRVVMTKNAANKTKLTTLDVMVNVCIHQRVSDTCSPDNVMIMIGCTDRVSFGCFS